MKVLHIVAGLEPGGGMAESVPQLCRYLMRRGHEVTLVTLAGVVSEATEQALAEGVRLVQYRRSWPGVIYFSWQMWRRLGRLAREHEVVQVHSQWTFPVWWGCWCALRRGKPLIMTPRGCFDPVRMAHGAWKKRLVGWLDRWFVRRASRVQVTSELERGWVLSLSDNTYRNQGSGCEDVDKRVAAACAAAGALSPPPSGGDERVKAGARVVVVPNGVVVPGDDRGDYRSQGTGCDFVIKRVVYLGRIHRLKGLDLLLTAWERVWQPGWELVVAGSGGHGGPPPREGGVGGGVPGERALPGCCGDGAPPSRGVRYIGPVYGREKWELLRGAELLVLPSRSENFGLVVAEALAVGVPVVATQGTPWAELLGSSDREFLDYSLSPPLSGGDERVKAGCGALGDRALPGCGRCGWWVEVSVAGIERGLRAAMALSDEERRMLGENGRRLVERRYRWEAVAEQMSALYAECVAEQRG